MIKYPFQVKRWMPPEPTLKYLGDGHWLEECRCMTLIQANRIARSLYVTERSSFVVVEFKEGEKEEIVSFYPSRDAVLQATENKV